MADKSAADLDLVKVELLVPYWGDSMALPLGLMKVKDAELMSEKSAYYFLSMIDLTIKNHP